MKKLIVSVLALLAFNANAGLMGNTLEKAVDSVTSDARYHVTCWSGTALVFDQDVYDFNSWGSLGYVVYIHDGDPRIILDNYGCTITQL